MKTWTTEKFKAAKGREKLSCVTAYDYTFARLADEAGVQSILVGDSLGMTMLGYSSTLPVTMDDMVSHTAAVARGAVTHALVLADMPFLSYQCSLEEGLRNAGRLLKEGGADAVKLEGYYPELTAACVKAGIPVCAHLGLTPQSVNVFGGYKVQAKTRSAVDRLLEEAHGMADAGAFTVVLECVPPDVARAVTDAVPIPTIGIGAGPCCDAQVLVMQDMLGLTPAAPKFVKRYAELGETVKAAFAAYVKDVADGVFPGEAECYKPAGV
ncbi:MAG: 3-methyl-2-oxobutanoate hydroxymethyltransferase [Kiritimatiellae bacterium]|nr:3-methyl-2-oxobutanoate hydroxymethyltransferase [Kiritimatiellia bacterium]